MSAQPIVRLGSIRDVRHFLEHVRSLGLTIPCDTEIEHGEHAPLRWPLECAGIKIGNRIAVQPMEGWDGTTEGNPSDYTVRRWRRFGASGAKLIWGGEAVAVSHEGRANPNQLVIARHTLEGLAGLRRVLIEEHQRATGSQDGLFIGLQLTHSGRFAGRTRATGPSRASSITIRFWIADWAYQAIIRFLPTRRLKRLSKVFIMRGEWRGSWASILWTSSTVTDTWATSFSVPTRGKESTGEVLKTARDF